MGLGAGGGAVRGWPLLFFPAWPHRAAVEQEIWMLYIIGMVLAGLGAGVLIGALTYVTLMLTVVIMSMFAFTAAPILDKVLKE